MIRMLTWHATRCENSENMDYTDRLQLTALALAVSTTKRENGAGVNSVPEACISLDGIESFQE